MQRRFAWFAAWPLLLWLAAPFAQAQPHPLEVKFSGCDEAMAASALRIAQIELASDGEASAALEQARVEVACDQAGALIRAQRQNAAVGKRMSFDSLDAATRARLLALGVAELSRELARLPTETVRSVPKPAPKPTPSPNEVKAKEPAWGLGLGPVVLTSTGARLLALGGRLGLERRASARLSLLLSAEATSARRRIPGGTLRWDQLALELSARAYLNPGTLRFYAEAGAAGAEDRLSGTSRQAGVRGASFSAFNGYARAAVGAQLSFLRHGLCAFALDVRYLLRRLSAENPGRPTTSIDPLLVSASLTAGARW